MTTESIFYYSLCTGEYKLFHETTDEGERYYVNWNIKYDVSEIKGDITREITKEQYDYLLEQLYLDKSNHLHKEV